MLDIKSLKFEKSINYLKEQLEVQNNNKQLVMDIMKNLSMLIDNSKDVKEQKEYQNIYNSALKHLQNISANIETLEKLDSTIGLLAFKLTKLAEAEKDGSKTKQYLIDTFAQFKDEVVSYTKSLQNLNKKIVDDTNAFNEFININNFKYNFSSIASDEGLNSNYEYTGFSVKDKNVDSLIQNDSDSTDENIFDISDIDINDIDINDIDIENYKNDENNIDYTDSSYPSISDILKTTALTNEVSSEEVSDEAPKKKNTRKSTSKNAKKTENKTEKKGKSTKKAEDKTEKKTKTTKKAENKTKSTKKTENKTEKKTKTTKKSSKSTKSAEGKKSKSTTSKAKKTSTNAKSSTKRVVSITKKISDVAQIKNNEEVIDNPIPADKDENKVTEDLLSNLDVQDLIDFDINEADLDVKVDDNNLNDADTSSNTDNNVDVNEDANNDISNVDNKESLEKIESRFEAKFKDLEDFEAKEEKKEDSPTDKVTEKTEKIEDIVKKNDFSQFPLDNITDKITDILSAKLDNETLLISEKTKTIYLPYKISELTNYIDSYPDVYNSIQDVVRQEFILPFDYFMKHPYKARFSEAYNILRNREGKGFIPSVTYSLNIARRYNLNPAIVAACKSQNELESYLYYLDTNNAHRFNFFNIIYEVNPLAKNNKKT